MSAVETKTETALKADEPAAEPVTAAAEADAVEIVAGDVAAKAKKNKKKKAKKPSKYG